MDQAGADITRAVTISHPAQAFNPCNLNLEMLMAILAQNSQSTAQASRTSCLPAAIADGGSFSVPEAV